MRGYWYVTTGRGNRVAVAVISPTGDGVNEKGVPVSPKISSVGVAVSEVDEGNKVKVAEGDGVKLGVTVVVKVGVAEAGVAEAIAVRVSVGKAVAVRLGVAEAVFVAVSCCKTAGSSSANWPAAAEKETHPASQTRPINPANIGRRNL
jgi:hypothetical protein